VPPHRRDGKGLAMNKALLSRQAAPPVARATVALGQIHHLFKSMELRKTTAVRSRSRPQPPDPPFGTAPALCNGVGHIQAGGAAAAALRAAWSK